MDSHDGGSEEASGDGWLGLSGGLEISLSGYKHLDHVLGTHKGESEHERGPEFLLLALPMHMVPAVVGSKVGYS